MTEKEPIFSFADFIQRLNDDLQQIVIDILGLSKVCLIGPQGEIGQQGYPGQNGKDGIIESAPLTFIAQPVYSCTADLTISKAIIHTAPTTWLELFAAERACKIWFNDNPWIISKDGHECVKLNSEMEAAFLCGKVLNGIYATENIYTTEHNEF